MAALARLRGVPNGWERSSNAAGLLAAVNAAFAIPKEKLPKLPRPPVLPEGTPAAAELIKVLLKLVSEKEGVAAKMLASGDDIERLAAYREKAEVPALTGWRREVFGEQVLKLLNGEVGLRFENRRIQVFPIDQTETPA